MKIYLKSSKVLFRFYMKFNLEQIKPKLLEIKNIKKLFILCLGFNFESTQFIIEPETNWLVI